MMEIINLRMLVWWVVLLGLTAVGARCPDAVKENCYCKGNDEYCCTGGVWMDGGDCACTDSAAECICHVEANKNCYCRESPSCKYSVAGNGVAFGSAAASTNQIMNGFWSDTAAVHCLAASLCLCSASQSTSLVLTAGACIKSQPHTIWSCIGKISIGESGECVDIA
eukprot:TRINITY_DN22120_c0_g1_i1.p1 TRINITY_DN22120_c0_g1~~TRINITY_DN22120_c0_g1_i1.p1  ORF type:complete len:167 (-),score=13.26 TRINITY_DN22120_c0_g1_i1:119-619(-)